MTDDEINRKVAEIEGWREFGGAWAHVDHCPRTYPSPPPYATDWAWCGPLIEKYRIYAMPVIEGWASNAYGPIKPEYADTPQRAICLAVIAAHKESKCK